MQNKNGSTSGLNSVLSPTVSHTLSSGFTLVELTIAVAVIAILTAITVFSFNAVRVETRDKDRAASATLIAEALEKTFLQNGEYPSPSALTNNIPANQSSAVAQKLGVDAATIITPRAPAGTQNSIAASASDQDEFVYQASSTTDNASCQTNPAGGCDAFTLSYKKEETNQIVTINSRQVSN